MVEHVDIPDGERHEPKGISSAASGEVYVSLGTGSGRWQNLNASKVNISDGAGYYGSGTVEGALAELKTKEAGGWGLYKDDGAASPIVSSTASKLSINGLGTETEESKLPLSIRGSGTLWDAVAYKITPIVEGDVYTVRLKIPVTAETGSPTLLHVQLDVGETAAPTEVVDSFFLPILAVAPYTLATDITFPVTTDFITNGGQIFLSTDTGTLTVNAPSIFINRVSNGSN